MTTLTDAAKVRLLIGNLKRIEAWARLGTREYVDADKLCTWIERETILALAVAEDGTAPGVIE